MAQKICREHGIPLVHQVHGLLDAYICKECELDRQGELARAGVELAELEIQRAQAIAAADERDSFILSKRCTLKARALQKIAGEGGE